MGNVWALCVQSAHTGPIYLLLILHTTHIHPLTWLQLHSYPMLTNCMGSSYMLRTRGWCCALRMSVAAADVVVVVRHVTAPSPNCAPKRLPDGAPLPHRT